jgi:hypothetical protein
MYGYRGAGRHTVAHSLLLGSLAGSAHHGLAAVRHLLRCRRVAHRRTCHSLRADRAHAPVVMKEAAPCSEKATASFAATASRQRLPPPPACLQSVATGVVAVGRAARHDILALCCRLELVGVGCALDGESRQELLDSLARGGLERTTPHSTLEGWLLPSPHAFFVKFCEPDMRALELATRR